MNFIFTSVPKQNAGLQSCFRFCFGLRGRWRQCLRCPRKGLFLRVSVPSLAIFCLEVFGEETVVFCISFRG